MRDRSPERHAIDDANALASLIHVIRGPQRTLTRHPLGVAVALLGAMAAVWILGTVPSGGPDEPVHIFRGAALVRGQLDGEPFPGQGRLFELPGWIGHPDHGCFSLISEQPASCATATSPPEGVVTMASTAISYPIWGHIAPGLATYFPSTIGNQLARVFDAAIPIGLLGASIALAARRGRTALAATAVAVTPMAWFSIIVVNPSGLVIAGGLALWAALLSVPTDRLPLDRLTSWTLAAGWAAMVLPRRDGMIWAATVVSVVAIFGVVDLVGLVRRIGKGPLALICVSTAGTVGWAATSSTVSSKFLFVAPLLPIIAGAARRCWESRPSVLVRGSILALGGVAVGAACAATMVGRRGGFDAEVLKRIVDESGANLEEAIGVLGWLDTPIPRVALLAWVVALGMLAVAALITGRLRDVGVAATVVLVAVVGAWVLEMSQGTTTGTYWQGRYSLPLLVGVPILLGFSDRLQAVAASRERVHAAVVGGIAMFVLTAAFAASMRRWGVGTNGSMLPWDWDTYGTVLPPWLLLALHAAVAAEITRRIASFGSESADSAEVTAATDSADHAASVDHAASAPEHRSA